MAVDFFFSPQPVNAKYITAANTNKETDFIGMSLRLIQLFNYKYENQI
jgi:hypothetical protein